MVSGTFYFEYEKKSKQNFKRSFKNCIYVLRSDLPYFVRIIMVKLWGLLTVWQLKRLLLIKYEAILSHGLWTCGR